VRELLIANPDYLALVAKGLVLTLKLFAASWVLAILLACLLAAIRSAPSKLGRRAVAGFVEYHRNVPGLVQVFVWYFGVPQLLPSDLARWVNRHDGEFTLSLIALTLYASAYMSEDLRSGLRALPRGQAEAARSLGFTFTQAMRLVLLPQALRAALPPLVSQTLNLFKQTSLAMTIGLAELMSAVRQIENETYRTFEAFLVASACYLAVSWTIMAVGAGADRRLNPARR
jgi:polar amino acid transport system permease protein